jgi:hypothetical protein
LWRGNGLLGVSSDQALDESCFSDAWGTDDAYDDRGSFFGEAVDEGDVEALFFDLLMLAASLE